MEAYWDHSWQGQRPMIYKEQMPQLLAVLAPVIEKSARSRSRKRNAKPAKVDKGSQSEGRTLLAVRSGGLCEICALAPAREWHHRKNRSQGGTWAASNGLHLCSADHAFITEHPAQAAQNGWTVRSHEDPSVTTVLRRGKWVLLDDFGGFELVSAVQEEGGE